MNAMKMRNYHANLTVEKRGMFLKKERMRQSKIRLEKKCQSEFEWSQNTVLLASTQTVYKAPHSTVQEQ